MSIPNVLTIAGTDPSGGAGIMADLKAFGALRTHGCAVVTAVVAQNTRGVAAVTQMTPQQVRTQLENLVDDVRIDALKIGMLGSAAVIETVADVLADHPALRGVPRVLDPVMVASSGDRLIDEDAVTALRERLVPEVDVITPNLAEAAVLLDLDDAPREASDDVARALVTLGSGVLLKGGHGGGATSDDALLVRLVPIEEPCRHPGDQVEVVRDTIELGEHDQAGSVRVLERGDRLRLRAPRGLTEVRRPPREGALHVARRVEQLRRDGSGRALDRR